MTESTNPPQEQDRQPGLEHDMSPAPVASDPDRQGAARLRGRKVLITGGDSGIGRAVAVLCAREGAALALSYLDEHSDAAETRRMVEEEQAEATTLPGDLGDPATAARVVEQAAGSMGGLDVVINNAAEQHVRDNLADITPEQLERTFRTNVFSMFYVTQAALPYLTTGASIINSTSVAAYNGNPVLIDYSATKGAIVSFTRALAQSLVSDGIRVNAVAPGPVWTPLIPASFGAEQVAEFGGSTPMGRPGEPSEMAPCYVFLASSDSSFMSGQVLHPNGGQPVGG